MRKIITILFLIIISKTASSQTNTTIGNICDDGNSFLNKTVSFKAIYSDYEQIGDKWPLRNQGSEYEKISTLANYGIRADNDIYYTRIIFSDCKIFLRIPYDITVPNLSSGAIRVTGKVSLVGNTYILIKVSNIQRL